MNKNARIGFAGTPEFACSILAGLLDGGYTPCVVYSQPDRPSGRGRKRAPSPTKALALAHNIPVQTPRSLRGPEPAALLREQNLDLLIVAAYGLLLPRAILQAPRLGCLNVHASLLPRWRGAAPIERAIMAGDSETGVALMQMDEGLDTGPVHRMLSTTIDNQTTGASLEAALAKIGSQELLALLPDLEHSKAQPQPEAGATYANKLTAADSAINWQGSAATIDRQVRALCERAPARTHIGDLQVQILASEPAAAGTGSTAPGTIISLDKQGLVVATGNGWLNVTRVRLNRGKGKPLAAADLRNGYSAEFAAGTHLAQLS